MGTDFKGIIARVEQLAGPALEGEGKELVLVEYLHEAGSWVLRLYVDRLNSSGITVDELASVSRLVGPLLEVEEIIKTPYRLEVSSPGIDRPLVKQGDFDRFKGRQAVISTAEAFEGRRNFKGILQGAEGDSVLIEEHDGVHRIPLQIVRKANLKETMGAQKHGQ